MTGSDADVDELELESRRAIYKAIEATPGIHFRALLDDLEYAQGTLQYHIRWLADADLVESSTDGKYTRYYPEGSFDEGDQAVMNALRRQCARRILAYLVNDGPMTTSELSECIDKAASTVSFHLSQLEAADLVTGERDGRAVQYDVTDPDRIARLYAVHHRSFTDRLVDGLFDLWDSY
ncbi:winged helix-turn-helix transcriptional regulator [Halorientalis salina]|uniref:winged helix-turn-helix transcriptional regulator n=1 Tax=Halorientalis salina TaxID=2932266 RepID=UPI0010AB9630|nr:metalloregulator ArsR/SmtB family transcription factor [Halorientalis salina]